MSPRPRAPLLLAFLVACGDGGRAMVNGGVDGGASGTGSAGAAGQAGEIATPEDPELVCTGAPPVMKIRDTNTGTELDPDWSCYEATPARREMRTVSFRARGVAMPAPGLVAGVTVDFFFEPSTLGTPAVTRVFDADSGSVTLEIPAGITTLSARIHPLARDMPAFNIVELREYDIPIPNGDAPIEGDFLIRDMRSLGVNLALGGGRDDPSKAQLIAYARDCRGRFVRGAQFELIDGVTNVPVQIDPVPGGVHVSYAQAALPTTTCTFTSAVQAQWMMINAPVNVGGNAKTHSYRLRLKGRKHPTDAQPFVLGEREVELFSGGTTVVVLYRQTSP